LNGNVLHDWHAEILAIRAFNRFLIDECSDLAADTLGRGSKWLKWRFNSKKDAAAFSVTQQQPFALRDDVEIHMYASEAPCGDASMELTIAEQDNPTPWASTRSNEVEATSSSTQESALRIMHGRGHFDQLGAVRRKPSRPDAPATLSKSCSDKLAMKQCTGLLSAITAQLVWPGNVYIRNFVLPHSQVVPEAFERAFGPKGRLAPLLSEHAQARWHGCGFEYRHFRVQTTAREFEFSKRFAASDRPMATGTLAASNRSCVYTPRCSEVLINGVLEGRRLHDPSGASCTSRRSMWNSALDVATAVGLPSLEPLMKGSTYAEVKTVKTLQGRERVKEDVKGLALKGWVKNTGDDGWTLRDIAALPE